MKQQRHRIRMIARLLFCAFLVLSAAMIWPLTRDLGHLQSLFTPPAQTAAPEENLPSRNADLEAVVPEAFRNGGDIGMGGAAVVVQYMTGEVVAMVSLPENPDAESAVNAVTDVLFPLGTLEAQLELPAGVFPEGFAFSDMAAASPEYPSLAPLHLCMITAAAANGGEMPQPRMLREKAAETVLTLDADTVGRLRLRMQDSVQGTGNAAAAAVSTMDIRGLSGVAHAADGTPLSWFTGYSAQQDLPYALCVLVKGVPENDSGAAAGARIAHELFTWLRNHPE